MSAPAPSTSGSANAAATKKQKEKEKEHQEIIANFQKMREEQRLVATKAAELQMDQKSHELVIETLKEVEKDRKCFRMIGGVLVERTVNEVLPTLEQNRDQITKMIESFQTQIVAKGKEINDFREKHNIRFQGEAEAGDQQKSSGEAASSQSKAGTSGVLVAKSN